MPGRPKQKAKRVLELVKKADDLLSEFRSIKPQRKEARSSTDPMGPAWSDGEAELERACRQVAKFAALACKKAGLEAPEEVVQAAADIADPTDTIHDGDDSVRFDDDTPKPTHWTEGPKCSFHEDLVWASSVLHEPDMKPEQAPGAQAWSLYVSYRQNDETRQAFWKAFGPSLIPKKREPEFRPRFEDDGGPIDITAIQRLSEEAMVEAYEQSLANKRNGSRAD